MLAAFAYTAEPLGAEKLFNIGPLPFTNSMLYGLVTAVFVLGLFGLAAKASQVWPKSRLAFWVENIVDLVFGLMLESFGGDRKRTTRHFPLLITLFVFILAGNLSGLLPGIQTIALEHGGEHAGLLRAWTTDLNSTLAMAILALTTVHVYAIKELGGLGYLRHFFSSGSFKNPMTYFIGLNELFGEVLRLVTLSLRLFGVIYGGEALLFAISSLAGNFGWAATLPIMFLEIFFSIVQAYLFMMLTATYLVMSTTHGESESHAKEASLAGSRA